MVSLRVEGINPEPWTAGGFSKTSKAVKSGKLHAYQMALKEEVQDWLEHRRELNVDYILPEPPYQVWFQFWRELEAGISGHTSRAYRGHISDATNIQKATEDALQGVLFTNDRYVRDIRSTLVDQGIDVEPLIVIQVETYPNA